MKEDILEQLVDDYLQVNGYFTRHNLKFRPRKDRADFDGRQDSNHSDIDVIGYHPRLRGSERVMVVSCKSWQSGFPVDAIIYELEHNKVRSGRPTWKAFRELMREKWSEALIAAVESATGCREFTYVTAVTAIKGDRTIWQTNQRFRDAMGGNPVQLLSLADMLATLVPAISTTMASSQLGRILQLLKASNCSLNLGSVPGSGEGRHA